MSPFFLYMVLISSVVEYAGKKKKILYESPFEGWSNWKRDAKTKLSAASKLVEQYIAQQGARHLTTMQHV